MPRPRWTVNRALAVAVAAATLLTLLCGVVVAWTARGAQIDALEDQRGDHEARLRLMEGYTAEIRTDLAEIRTDVKWIRAELASPQPPAPSP